MSARASTHFYQKDQIMATFVASASGSFLLIKLIYEEKLKQRLTKFRFPSDFNVTFTPDHWSNLDKCEELFQLIIFPYLPTKKRELGCPEDKRALIIMDTFKDQDNDEVKQFCQENNCELATV